MANAAKVHDKVKRARASADAELAKARAKAERKVDKIQAALAGKEARILATLEDIVTRAEAKLRRSGGAKRNGGATVSRERKPAGRVVRAVKKKR
jgi:hypothetical protein